MLFLFLFIVVIFVLVFVFELVDSFEFCCGLELENSLLEICIGKDMISKIKFKKN